MDHDGDILGHNDKDDVSYDIADHESEHVAVLHPIHLGKYFPNDEPIHVADVDCHDHPFIVADHQSNHVVDNDSHLERHHQLHDNTNYVSLHLANDVGHLQRNKFSFFDTDDYSHDLGYYESDDDGDEFGHQQSDLLPDDVSDHESDHKPNHNRDHDSNNHPRVLPRRLHQRVRPLHSRCLWLLPSVC